MSGYTECFDGIRKRMGKQIESHTQYLKGKVYALDDVVKMVTKDELLNHQTYRHR